MPQPLSVYTTPWVPALDGKDLAESSFTIDLVVEQQRPSSRRPEDAAWTKKGCEADLEGAPSAARTALDETVVELWRIRETLEDGRGDSLFLDHLEALLVRRINRD